MSAAAMVLVRASTKAATTAANVSDAQGPSAAACRAVSQCSRSCPPCLLTELCSMQTVEATAATAARLGTKAADTAAIQVLGARVCRALDH